MIHSAGLQQMATNYREETVVEAVVGKFTTVAFVPHATDRMAQRSITQTDVLTALRNPTIRGLPADVPHKRIAWKKSKARTLSVVYDECDATKLRVITAYWL